MYASTKINIVEPDIILSSIHILGPSSVGENSGAQYTCTAYYSDGSIMDITGDATWGETSAYASISSSGYLSTGSVSSDKSCIITASYQGKSDTHNLVIKNILPVLSHIAISGPEEVMEQTGTNYTCRAYYSDGTSKDVTDDVAWGINLSFAYFSSVPGQEGYLWSFDVSEDQKCTISAEYEGKLDSAQVIIKQFINVLQGSGTQSDPYLVPVAERYKNDFEMASSSKLRSVLSFRLCRFSLFALLQVQKFVY
jgi:hypothetical protein